MGTAGVLFLTFLIGMVLSCVIAIPFIAKAPVGNYSDCFNHRADKYRDGNLKVLFRNRCRRQDGGGYCEKRGNHYCCQVSLRFKSFHELERYIIKRILKGYKVMPEKPYAGMGECGADGITFRINNSNNTNQQSSYQMEILRIENERGCLFNRSSSGRGRNHCSKEVEKWIKDFGGHLNDIKEINDIIYYAD